MNEKTMHLIAFDIPVPVNYGGAIDIYHKIKALHSLGVKIKLHCFQYGRSEAPQLKAFCQEVHYYPRRINPLKVFSKLPYIVFTRHSKALLQNLLLDNDPILFEGLHSCYLLDHPALKDRKKIVRTHNIEHDYYTCLGKVEKHFFRKQYFFREAERLRIFEQVLVHAQGIAAISLNDKNHFCKHYDQVERVSAFHPFGEISAKPGLGKYVLYHGSLEVGENNEAALFLVNQVFAKTGVPFIIAGNKASKELVDTASRYTNIEIKSSVSTEDIYRLVSDAQINILPTFQATGIKLKLLAALFSGRHCVVNEPMVKETGLESLCTVADTPEEMIESVGRLMELNFDASELQRRRKLLLEEGFSNEANAKKLISLIFN